MIPEELQGALEAGRIVRTLGGIGPTIVHRLADLVLPTGRIVLGYPGSRFIDEPSPVRPRVPPGRYPVFASLADVPSRYQNLAFVVVRFEDTQPSAWEDAGSFFTDSGLGCLMDEASVPLVKVLQQADPDFWGRVDDVKFGVFRGGDCNLVLDEPSGANAVVFKTRDLHYPCFLGTGHEGRIAWLVVDCR